MNRFGYHSRWIIETLVILVVISAVPHLYKAFSHDHDPYYDPDGPGYSLPIGVSPMRYSTQSGCSVTANGNVAIFTNVRFKWKKIYNPYQQGNYYSDMDLRHADGNDYIIPDTVQYRLYVFGEPDINWTNDPTSITNDTLYSKDYCWDSPNTITYSLKVRDDIDHYGPPGTTNDLADEEETMTIDWVGPNKQYTEHIQCSGHPDKTYGHQDVYVVTLRNSSDESVDFDNLYIRETISEYYDGCNLPEFGAEDKYVKITNNSRVEDHLRIGDDDPPYEAPATCTVIYKQESKLYNEAKSLSWNIPYTNYLHYTLLSGGDPPYNLSQARTRLQAGSGTSDNCPDWQYTPHGQ